MCVCVCVCMCVCMKVCVIVCLQMRLYKSLSRFECVCVCVCVEGGGECYFTRICVCNRLFVFIHRCVCIYKCM